MKIGCLLAEKKHYIEQRAEIIRLVRNYLDTNSYLEVDTPLRVRSPGTDVHLEAFETEDRYLITSPEFYMKRLLAAGFDRIYQICRCFRKGERTPLHNPEFCMLEFYCAGMNLEGMMRQLEEMIWMVAKETKKRTVKFNEISCSLEPPWQRITVEEAFFQFAGWSPVQSYDENRFYFDLVDKVERQLGTPKPTLLYHYPAELAMLSKISKDNPRVARRFELYISSVEIANAFEELTDAAEQRRRFEKDLNIRRNLSKQLYPIDEEFLNAIPSVPPCSGIAIGLDRLAMLLSGSENIINMIAFPEEMI